MPLRIFERRYLDLVRDSLREGHDFGVVWIRRGEEVASRGQACPELGDWGTSARIVDWYSLDNGLLGITIEGCQRFSLLRREMAVSQLMTGRVRLDAVPPPLAVTEQCQPLLNVLRSLTVHPHIEQLQLQIDDNNAWQVVYSLIQLLPLEESLKYALLGLDDLATVVRSLNDTLSRISGEG